MSRRAANLRYRGLSEAHYRWMLKHQNGGCAICGSTDSNSRYEVFFVDHCHTTGKVRGLLCSSCNTGIGLFKDDPVLMQNAIRYVTECGLNDELQHLDLPIPKPIGQRYTPECHQRKLNWKKAEEIKRAYYANELSQGELAAKYYVSQAMVSRIVLGKAWVKEDHGKPISDLSWTDRRRVRNRKRAEIEPN